VSKPTITNVDVWLVCVQAYGAWFPQMSLNGWQRQEDAEESAVEWRLKFPHRKFKVVRYTPAGNARSSRKK
jgi:hypothetical protein